VPSIESVSLSSLQPGPDERVTATIRGGDDTTLTGIESATVYAPDGSEVNASINGRTVGWTTQGTGTHVARLTVADTTGNQHVLPVRVRARKTSLDQPPSVRAVETPFGTVAQTGDGLAGGGISVADDGSVTITAEVPDDRDIPPEVHIYTEGTSTTADADTTIQIARGQQRQSINKHVRTVIHGQTLAEDAIVYRQTDAQDTPLTREGSEWGVINARDDGTTIQTVTGADGSVTLSVNNNPSTFDRLQYQLDQLTADLPIVGSAIIPVQPASMPPPGGLSLSLDAPIPDLPLAAPADPTPAITAALSEV